MAKKSAFDTPAFKELQKQWYLKLEKSGFDDIEKGEPETVVRPQVIKTKKKQYEGGASYWELCQQILREYPFKRPVDRAIFEMHAEGLSFREISDKLMEREFKRITYRGVHKIVMRIKEAFLRGAD